MNIVQNKQSLKSNGIVFITFPKTGLGNMLFIWARGLVFSQINRLPMVTASWWGFRWGAIIRKEKRNRLYWKYFKETPLLTRLAIKLSLKQRIIEPPVQRIDLPEDSKIYCFNTVMPDVDLFVSLRDHKELIRLQLLEILHPVQKKNLSLFNAPEIGIHVRRGDFLMGSNLTPLAFFIKGINLIREEIGKEITVTIFSDATKEELKQLLNLPFTTLAAEKADILDIILLSKSKILMLSASSTFSYWGAFLSEAFVIRPHTDWLININDDDEHNCAYKEMKWDARNEKDIELLKSNFRHWLEKCNYEF
ncbi:MAG: alpha-1,2-fucosyltransferase [Ferruginibacter sp.]